MNRKITVFGYVVSLLLLTGCKDKVKEEYHKKAATCSAKVAGGAAKNALRHGYEVVCAEGKKVKENVKNASKRFGEKINKSLGRTTDGAKHVVEVAADKANQLGSTVAQKAKNLKNKAQEEVCCDHNKELNKNFKAVERKDSIVTEKEIYTVSDLDTSDDK